MTTVDTLQSGTATVAGDPDFSDGPWTVHGVAQASEVTRGVSGERRYWPPETLRDAVEKLVGTPLVDPSDHEDLTPGQADPTTIIGEVTAAAFDAEREALVYEAELDDPEFAKLAARGRIDVSPSVQLRDGEEDPERNATRVAEVLGYRDLAAVTEGAHASASIHLGTAEALARHFGVDTSDVLDARDAPLAYENLQRDRARRPTYSGTVDEEWSTPTLDDYLEAYASLPDPGEADSVTDLTDRQRSLVARKSLLGTAAGETLREVRFFPVVDPASDRLNRRALGAVRSGRGAQADIPRDALASARNVAENLLTEEFGVNTENMADVSDVQEGTLVRWNSSGERPAYGRVEEVRAEDDSPLDTEIDGDQTIQPPAALIEVHRPTGDDGGWEPSGTMVGHTLNTATLTVVDELPDPGALAQHRGGDDGHKSPGQSTPVLTDDSTTMSDLTDREQELLAAARQRDDPTVVEAGVPERLTDHEALLDAAESCEDPTVVETREYETLQERIATVEGVLADALQARTGLSDAAIEAMPFEAMAAEFETDDGDLDVEALVQSPETGTGPSDPGTDDPDEEALERIEAIQTKLDTVGNALPNRRVEALRAEAADLADADDYEAALEVL